MLNQLIKILKTIVIVVDHIVFIIVFPVCLGILLFTTPWILRQRMIWEKTAKGSPRALILKGFTVKKIKTRGEEMLLPFRNPSLKWIGFLDPANVMNMDSQITGDFSLITWKSPAILRFLEKIGFAAHAIFFRELIVLFKMIRYCVSERIGVLRAYKYDYPALRACLVSAFIKIPYIVDVMSNFELIRRLTGKAYYFRNLNKLPLIRFFAGMATNWLLGLPLRRAACVLGRNKNNYEHAFALGAPVKRLSLLRISNFDPAFNSHSPAHLPQKPADYPYMLLVGRLVEIKYPLDAIAAFELAAARLPEHRLVIIGDGALRHEVELRREHSEFKDRIVLLGACSSDVVYCWTAHAQMAVCPYSGSTLVEAMLCGVPVVAYDVEWHAEIVIDDYTGYLVPFADIKAFAEKMVYLAQHAEEARKVGMHGRELARVAFNKDKIFQKESMLYRQVLAK
jgi:glycosyltransferase involved in cell wall biosynthesis